MTQDEVVERLKTVVKDNLEIVRALKVGEPTTGVSIGARWHVLLVEKVEKGSECDLEGGRACNLVVDDATGEVLSTRWL